jgi:hypothetical protein
MSYPSDKELTRQKKIEEFEAVKRATQHQPAPAQPQGEDGSDDSQQAQGAQPQHSASASKPNMLQGGVQYCVPRGTPVKLKLATVLQSATELKSDQRDLDGNIAPAKIGQEISAKTQEDLYVDDNKVIPEGTVFHGVVTKILPPKRMNRPGSLEISFNALETPDHRVFEFHAEADSKYKSTNKTKLKGFGRLTAYAAGGAIVGAMVAYQVFGIRETIAMHGYNIAGAAAGGALLATAYAAMKHGHAAELEPGQDLNMQINSDLLMPAAVEAKAKLTTAPSGVAITINRSKLINDGLDGHLLRLDVKIQNGTSHPLNSIDLYVEDSNGNRNSLCEGLEDNAEYIFKVEPHEVKNARLYFQVEWPKLSRKLVWVGHDSRRIAYQAPCP